MSIKDVILNVCISCDDRSCFLIDDRYVARCMSKGRERKEWEGEKEERLGHGTEETLDRHNKRSEQRW